MDDIELRAMSSVNDVVKDLADEQRIRVIQWLGARYIGTLTPTRVIHEGRPSTIDSTTVVELEAGVSEEYSSFAELLAISNTDKTTTVDRLLLAAYWLQTRESIDKWHGYQLTKLMKPEGFPVDHPIRTMEPLLSSRPAKMFQSGRDASKGRNAEFYSLTPTGIATAITLIGVKLVAVVPTDGAVPADQKTKKARVPKTKESFSIIKDLDLSEKSNSQSLRSFYSEKKPESAMERIAVFVYFLERIAKVTGINLNHIYSCYKDVGEKVPTNLRQSAKNTSSGKGWVVTKTFDAIKVATPGENFVEFDLPKPKAK